MYNVKAKPRTTDYHEWQLSASSGNSHRQWWSKKQQGSRHREQYPVLWNVSSNIADKTLKIKKNRSKQTWRWLPLSWENGLCPGIVPGMLCTPSPANSAGQEHTAECAFCTWRSPAPREGNMERESSCKFEAEKQIEFSHYSLFLQIFIWVLLWTRHWGTSHKQNIPMVGKDIINWKMFASNGHKGCWK